MSLWSFLGDLLGKGASTVAPVVVNAASSAGSSLGSTLGSTAGSALGSALAGGSSGGGGGGGGDYTTVAPIEVTAPSGNGGDSWGGDMGDWGGALSAALASYNAPVEAQAPFDFSGMTPSAVSTPQLANFDVPTSLEGVEVTATGQRPRESLGLPSVSPGLIPLTNDTPQVAEEDLTFDEPVDPNESEEDRKKSLLAKYGPLGLLGLLGTKGLLAGGLLGASLLSGSGGGGSGGKNDAQTGLNNLAGNNAALARQLAAAGLANMNGNISGSGLNYINRMVKNAQAAIRQRYAGMGMSGSTAEQQDLNAAAMSGVDMQFKIGQEMAQTGLNAAAALSGQSATIYAALMNQQTQKDSQLGNALASFAGAVAT